MTKPILLVIDFINDIVHPEGKIAGSAKYIQEHGVIVQANNAIAWARKKAIPIVHVKVGFSADYLECPISSPIYNRAKALGALKLNTWGTEFHVDMDVQTSDTVIVKHRVNALYATELPTILTANAIDTLIICGVSTNGAVQSITRDAHDQDYKVVVLEDACGDHSEELQRYAITLLGYFAKITKVAELTQTIL